MQHPFGIDGGTAFARKYVVYFVSPMAIVLAHVVQNGSPSSCGCFLQLLPKWIFTVLYHQCVRVTVSCIWLRCDAKQQPVFCRMCVLFQLVQDLVQSYYLFIFLIPRASQQFLCGETCDFMHLTWVVYIHIIYSHTNIYMYFLCIYVYIYIYIFVSV